VHLFGIKRNDCKNTRCGQFKKKHPVQRLIAEGLVDNGLVKMRKEAVGPI
jgi:hypothetical protein